MSEESLAVQKLLVSTLKADASLLGLVAASSIFDRHARPEVFPCIILGAAQVVGEDVQCGELSTVYSTLHVWSREDGFEQCKRIAGAIRRALYNVEATIDGFAVDMAFEDSRFLRDPDGVSAHGVMTFASNVEEA